MTEGRQAEGVQVPALMVPFLDLSAMHAEVAGELDTTWREVMAANAFIGGEFVAGFERQWADYCGVSHAVGVANGTDAIALTLRGLGVGAGDEVVVPANTFVATAEAVALVGAVPRFVDVDPSTLLMTADSLRTGITPRTAAVIVVHLFGQLADMDALGRVAEAANIALIEDAAQAHGGTWRGRKAGTFGHAACFSFYPGKNLGALGDAGAVVTNDEQLAARIRSMSNHGRGHSNHAHALVGTNSRLDGLQAGALSIKLRRLDAWNRARQSAAAAYRRQLDGTSVRLVEVAEHADSVHHLLVARVPDRATIREELKRRGVQTGVHYPVPCHLHPAFANTTNESLPTAEQAADEILSLPMFPHISNEQISHVCTSLQKLLVDIEELVTADAR